VLADDAFTDRQTQACPARVESRRDERFKDIGQHVARDSWTVILHGHRNSRLTVPRELARPHANLAALRITGRFDGVHGVAQKVHEHLDQTVGVACDLVSVADFVLKSNVAGTFIDRDQFPGLATIWFQSEIAFAYSMLDADCIMLLLGPAKIDTIVNMTNGQHASDGLQRDLVCEAVVRLQLPSVAGVRVQIQMDAVLCD
jgi:hypothetical protein